MTPISSSSPPRDRGQHRRSWLLGVALVCCLLAVVAMPALAQSGSDTTAPTLADAERGNATTIVVTVTDDQDVDETSITLSDLDLSTGLVENANVTERGSNATVALTLANSLDTDNVTVSLTGAVRDTTGNIVSSGSVTATNMDSQQPRLLGFSVERLNETHGRITVETTEPLSELTLAIGGANGGNFDEANFTETIRPSGSVQYVRVHEFEREGESRLLLMQLTDESGNSVAYNARRNYLTDRTPPTAAITGPTHVTVGDRHTFASGAADNVGIESIRWSIEPDATRAGRSIAHTFGEPGPRTLAVTVTDGRNQTVTVHHNVTVLPGASKAGADVTPVTANRTNVTVSADRAARRVRLADDRGHLVSRDGVTVESLTVTPPANTSLWASVTVSGQASAFTTATGRRSVAGITVEHPRRDTAENVTVAFSVDRLRLQAAGLAPEEVSLYRLNGSWRELPTRVRWSDSDSVHFEASSPGLSQFAIGATNRTEQIETNNETGDDGTATEDGTTNETDATATPTATPTGASSPASLVVTAATIADTTVPAGEYAVVTATVANQGGRTGSTTLALTANESTMTTRVVTVPPAENRTVQFAIPVTETVALAVNGTAAGTVTVTNGAGDGTVTRAATQTAQPTATATAVPDQTAATAGQNTTAVNATTDGGGGGLPNPLALWPGGLLGTVLAGLIGLVTVTFGVLKALAIYLGY